MTVTTTSFRTDFPEFADIDVYPDSGVTYWLSLAGLLLDVCRWDNLLDTGTELFTAHNLVLEARAQAQAAFGAIPGETTGPLSGKTVDKVSATYDVASGIEKDAGHWNLTIFGTRFINLARMIGSGGLQL